MLAAAVLELERGVEWDLELECTVDDVSEASEYELFGPSLALTCQTDGGPTRATVVCRTNPGFTFADPLPSNVKMRYTGRLEWGEMFRLQGTDGKHIMSWVDVDARMVPADVLPLPARLEDVGCGFNDQNQKLLAVIWELPGGETESTFWGDHRSFPIDDGIDIWVSRNFQMDQSTCDDCRETSIALLAVSGAK